MQDLHIAQERWEEPTEAETEGTHDKPGWCNALKIMGYLFSSTNANIYNHHTSCTQQQSAHTQIQINSFC